jgi:hypothetical protein
MDTLFESTVLATAEAPSCVQAELGYLQRTTGRPYDYAYPPPAGTGWQNYRSDTRSVRITDARSLAAGATLKREGFELRETATSVSDFTDEAAIRSVYYREAAALAMTATRGKAAYVFDHLVRKRERGVSALTFGRRVAGDKPSTNGRVHTDYTELSAPRRMAQVLGEKASGCRRYAIVNIWRPITQPVLDAPLALCDARTVSPADLVESDVYYPTRTGRIYLVTYSPRHRWFYYSAMQRREALIFKQYDSDLEAPRFVPHAAFDHPETPPDASPRESIEVRCVVIFD